ncbi:zinc-binding dehydrogenase [Parasedimentitalea maritima]|uniref:Zinc-binding dehydrogenase n=1 Tax=Parasedimentitalea maritima TaxID=2578117 RepID=A0A6A4R6C4_9RHOB|nr:zinc-binding dehydrogenase [Zongyanglinia marina]
MFGDHWDNWGGFAEFVCTKETAMEHKPQNATFEQAAAVPQAGGLAMQGLRTAGQLPPGQKVLINGAGGGVGTFAIQLAKLADAEVTGVDAGHKLDVMRMAGSDHVIDYAKTDFTESSNSYDLIIDCQCNRPMRNYKRVMAPDGALVMVGGKRILPVLMQGPLARFTGEPRTFHLAIDGPNIGLTEMKELIEADKLYPVIDQTYPLCEVPDAMRYFEDGRHKGKIVISI